MEQIMKDNREYFKWPTPIADEFLQLTWDVLALKAALANYYQQRCPPEGPPMALFHVTIKSHYSVHLALFARHSMSITKVWCYSGEAFMKKLKLLVTTNSDGTPLHRIEPKSVEQYAYGMQNRFKKLQSDAS